MYHREVTGAPSYNLDAWLMGQDGVRRAFARVAPADGVAIIEGVMGMFDGRATGSDGSTAEVAAIVRSPVLLVLDVGGMSRSAAALVRLCTLRSRCARGWSGAESCRRAATLRTREDSH